MRIIYFIIGLIGFLFMFALPFSVMAQSPSNWQIQATGLKTQTNSGKTGGLGFVVQNQGWPDLQLHKGAGTYSSWQGTYLAYLNGIDLGQISIPGTTGTFVSETSDWSHNEIIYTNGASQLKLTISRLSPAVLINSAVNSLGIFAGPSNIKYVAYSTGGATRVQTLNSSDLSLPVLDKNWLLVWYGTNSHFNDSKIPLTYQGVPVTNAYQADAPMLVIFQNPPASISKPSGGGIKINFSTSAGNVVVLPLYGMNNLKSSDTETWSGGLPSSVQQKITFWASHLCSFPQTVLENYNYNPSSDTASITDTFSYVNVCSGGTSFAPLPPELSLAKDSLPIQFSGTVIDGNIPTDYGPIMGIENTSQYTWSLTGLKKYTDSQRTIGTSQVPSELEQELIDEVNKMIPQGHLAPWIYIDSIPSILGKGELYWANPADSIYQLAEIIPAITNTTVKNNLINYLKTERSAYPPETEYDLTHSIHDSGGTTEGAKRGNYSYYGGDVDFYWNMKCATCNLPAHLTRVGLYNFFSLSRYYDLAGETVPSGVISSAKIALDNDMKEQDWATFYWFHGFEDRRIAVVNSNRFFAGMIGYVKLAKSVGDNTEGLGRALLAKAAILRTAVAKYPRYLYASGLNSLPADPAWQPKYGVVWDDGIINNYSWSTPYDDVRQVVLMDQFRVNLFDSNAFFTDGWWSPDWDHEWQYQLSSPSMIAYKDMVPELGRFMEDYLKNDALVYLNKAVSFYPNWYMTYAEGDLGAEHNMNHPSDSFQLFNARAWIQGETPDNLARYAGTSWLSQGGDLFYMQKLAEAVKAYKGISWSDGPAPTSGPTLTPTPSCKTGDVNCNGTIDTTDLLQLLGNYGKSGIGDLNNDNKVNMIDAGIVVKNWNL